MILLQLLHCLLPLVELRPALLLDLLRDCYLVEDDREFLVGRVKREDSEREVVQSHVVDGLRTKSLRRHVGEGARAAGVAGQLVRVEVEETGDTEVGDLGPHVRREEDVAGGEVAVHDGRVEAVKVEEAVRDVHEDGEFDGERYVGELLQALLQVGVQVLEY